MSSFTLWLYSAFANTPESQSRALAWIRRALPKARTYLQHGDEHAGGLTEEYVRLLEESGKSDEALLACEATLGLALRSPKRARINIRKLWEKRGHLLRSSSLYLAAARSYARCLALELQHEKPAPFRQIDLHCIIGEMYLQAEAIPAARMHLLKAHDLLETHWLDDPQDAGKSAAAVGLALGRAQEEAKGQAMLRRAMAGPPED